VKRGASKEEIKAAYKKLVAQYHPDKVQHLGKEFQELAHKKFVAIQRAYDVLMK
jgi:DnaJ-class molecular chaperone